MEDQEGTTQPSEEPIQDSQAPVEEPTQPDKGDYLARVQSDPDFAVSQIREKDRTITKRQQELEKFKPIAGIADQLGGAQGILDHLQRWGQVRSNPQLAKLVDSYLETGQLQLQPEPGAEATDQDDDYLDPEVKSRFTKYEGRISELEGMLNEAVQRLNQAETRGLTGSLEKNIDVAVSRFPEGDLRQRALEMIQEKVNELEAAASKGDDFARRSLKQLSEDEGRTFKYLTSDLYEENVESIVSALQSQKASKVAEHATTRPGSMGSGNSEMPIKLGTDPRAAVRQALRSVAQKRGVDLNNLA